jgi:hypothetical protein
MHWERSRPLTRQELSTQYAVHPRESKAPGLMGLRRMLNKAREWKVIAEVPDFKLFQEEGRALRLDDQGEAKLLPLAVYRPR